TTPTSRRLAHQNVFPLMDRFDHPGTILQKPEINPVSHGDRIGHLLFVQPEPAGQAALYPAAIFRLHGVPEAPRHGDKAFFHARKMPILLRALRTRSRGNGSVQVGIMGSALPSPGGPS